jgi:hypothetical protein
MGQLLSRPQPDRDMGSDLGPRAETPPTPRSRYNPFTSPMHRALTPETRGVRQWAQQDSNLRASDYESAALTAEL